jgi:hypothetical protein
MLRWSPGAVRATVGVGGLGLTVCYMELLAQWQLPAPYPLVFVLAFAPMLVFMFTGDADGPWARRAQWMAIGWYGVGVLVSLAGLVQRGFAKHDFFFIALVAIGAWPCLLAARRLAPRAHAPAGAHAGARAPACVAPDPSFEPGDRPVVLQGVRGKWVRVFLVMAVMFAFGLTPGYQRMHPVIVWATLAFCGLGGLIAAAQLALPAARSTLTLDAAGLAMRSWGREHRTAWADIEGFGLMRISGATMVSLAYRPGYAKQRAARRFAAALTGTEGAIPDHYEVPGAELAALLERWRARFGAAGSDAAAPR